MTRVYGGTRPPVVLASSWDEKDPAFEWRMMQPNHPLLKGFDSRQTNTPSGSFRVWYHTNFGGKCETYAYYAKYDPSNTLLPLEIVGFPYETTGGKSLAPGSTMRAVMMSLFTSLLEQINALRWVVVVWSIIEVWLGFRGRAWNAPDRWRPTILRGILPAIVASIGSDYAFAMILFVVSCLPFYRGKIQTVYIMETQQFAGDLAIQIIFSLFALWCITKTCHKLTDSGGYYFDNPLSLIVASSIGGTSQVDFWLRDGPGWGAILGSYFIIYACQKTLLLFFAGPLRMWFGVFTHEHSRSFYSWRVRHQIRLARGLIEPALGSIDFLLDFVALLVVFILLFIIKINVPIFFLTFMSYEMDLGYSIERDVMTMTALNVCLFPNVPLKDCLVEFDDDDDEESTFVSHTSKLVEFEVSALRHLWLGSMGKGKVLSEIGGN